MVMPKFGTKTTLLGYFWARNLKNYCDIWNEHPRICLIAKFREIRKMAKFGTKKASFEYFWAKIFEKLLWYLKSTPSNLLDMSLWLIQWILV